MPELTDLQKARLKGQVAVNVRGCIAARRYEPNLDMRKCLEQKKYEHQSQISRNYSSNGLYINLARDFLSDEYKRAINEQQQGGRKRCTRKRSTRKRNTVKHTRKSR